MEQKHRIVFMGTPDFAVNILQGLIDHGYEIVCAVTQPDKEVGRKRVLRPSPVKQLCLESGIPVLTPQRIRKEYAEVLAYEPDLIITAAYGQIIPKQLLDYPRFHAINTHGSLLPAYRGASPIQTALMNGEDVTGMTIMYMNEKMDEGDILYQRSLPIDIHDTNSTLFKKMSDLALEMLLEILPEIFEDKVRAAAQDHSKATYAPLLDKDIEHIFFNEDVKKVYDHIRGLLDDPGCFFVLKGKRYRIEKVFFTRSDDCRPGVFAGLEDDHLRLDCLNGHVDVYQLKPEGKNSMDAKSFYNGNGRNLAGESLE